MRTRRATRRIRRSTRLYSPYLLAIAAGAFVHGSVRTAQGALAHLNARETKADLAELFASTPTMATFFFHSQV
ncbi:hypothetical protein CKY28_08840 [Sphingomonas lenta]|uniref:Uncharacterized protein n=1 Tax=Sphingomonas lenta TaxID=1141887 RepID=A0A2A2SEV0_9SPHN|nr:hypothetical protein CKY28_08840 [Sphingomonas lenta]